MFANAYQSGFISIFYSIGSKPLSLWDKEVKNGHIRRLVDDEVKSLVLEVSGTNVTTTFITCPVKPHTSLGIKMPFLVMIIKNMKKYFTFEIQIKDDKNMSRRFRVSNFQSTTKVRPFSTSMPIGLSPGWNQVQFNLADFTKRAYGSTYLETVRIQVHANVRIRRIYFCDQLYNDEDMPNEYKLFLPLPATQAKKLSKTPSQIRAEKGSIDKLKLVPSDKQVPSGAPPTPAGFESGRWDEEEEEEIGEEEEYMDEMLEGEEFEDGEEGGGFPTERTETTQESEATTEESPVAGGEEAGEPKPEEAPPEGAEAGAEAPPTEAPSGDAPAEEAPQEAPEEPPSPEAEPKAEPEPEAPPEQPPEEAPAPAEATEETPDTERTEESTPAETPTTEGEN